MPERKTELYWLIAFGIGCGLIGYLIGWADCHKNTESKMDAPIYDEGDL